MVTVHHNGQPSFYSQVTDAVSNAQSGDTIYIPGGTYPIGDLEIRKELHIYGIGHNPDSSKATAFTILSGGLIIGTGSDNLEVIGIKLIPSGSGSFGGSIVIGEYPELDSTKVSGIKISRCFLTSISFDNPYGLSDRFRDNIICENVVSVIDGGGFAGNDGNIFSNNIISTYINNVSAGNIISNNIFLNNYPQNAIINIYQSVIQNNIVLTPCCYNDNGYNQNNFISNNLFVNTSNNFVSPTNILQENIYSQDQLSIFINQSGSSFDYSHDYHLKLTSPGKNAGADGTDVGIYGGLYPWKEGSIPTNPHIQSKIISSNTDASGNLPVNIKVAAQDH